MPPVSVFRDFFGPVSVYDFSAKNWEIETENALGKMTSRQINIFSNIGYFRIIFTKFGIIYSLKIKNIEKLIKNSVYLIKFIKNRVCDTKNVKKYF